MTHQPAHCLVWGELPVRDLDTAIAFYSDVTGMVLQPEETGPNPVAMFQPADKESGIALHLYPGTPAQDGRGPTLHLSAGGPLEATMDRVTKAGGQVLSPAIEIPAGRFFYATDPDGNSIGLFETPN